MERRHRRLEAQARDAQRDSRQRQRVRRDAAARKRVRDRGEVRRAGRAVDQREAVQQRRRADRADDQVLQPRLQRMLAPQFRRAHHVQRDRQELEAHEQRDRVLRARQHRHAADRRQQQRMKLAVSRFVRRQRAPCQQHRARAARDQDQVQRERQVVDAQRPREDRLVRVPLPDRQPQRRSERHQAERRHDLRANPARTEQAHHQHDHRAAQQRDQRREPREVDVRAFQMGRGRQRVGHGSVLASAAVLAVPVK